MLLNRTFALALITALTSALFFTDYADAAFKTKGEQAMYELGTCVSQNGKAKCKAQMKKACGVIAAEAFRNAYTTKSLSNYYKDANAKTRKDWEKKTANQAMRKSGLGSPC